MIAHGHLVKNQSKYRPKMICRRRFGGKTRVYRKSLPRVGSSRHCSARVRLKVFCRFPKSRFPSTNLRCEEGVGPNKHPPSTPSGFNNFPCPLVSRLPTSCNVVRASGIQYTYLAGEIIMFSYRRRSVLHVFIYETRLHDRCVYIIHEPL